MHLRVQSCISTFSIYHNPVDSGVAEETKETGKQSTRVPTKSDEELKKVVDRLKLTDSYDIDKLRFLTQVCAVEFTIVLL